MNTSTIALGLAIATLFTACKSPRATPQIWPGASPEVRSRLGTVEVQIDRPVSRQFTFEVPDTRAGAAHDLSGMAVSRNLIGAGGAGTGAIFVLALVPFTAAGGAIYGSLAGVSKTDLHDALKQMGDAVRASDLLVHFPEHVLEQARAQNFPALEARGPSRVCETKLRLRAVTQHLVQMNESPNAPLWLHYVVEVQVLDAGDALLYRTYVTALSPPRKFTEWAAHDGEILRRESQQMMQDMASQIVSRVFRGEDSP